MENKDKLYFAIDSDVLRVLTFIDLTLKNNPDFDLRSSQDPLLKKWSGYFYRLLTKAKNDELRFVIVDAVYQESQHSSCLLNFMREYCYFPKINAVNYQKKAHEARKLANAYCSPYELGDKSYPAPMKTVFNAESTTFSPTNDCYIMAQATIEGLCLITANGKDFIFDEKSKSENHHRAKGIINVNISKGYYASSQGKFHTPRPFHINTIGPMLKDETLNFEAGDPFNEFDLGKDLINPDDLVI